MFHKCLKLKNQTNKNEGDTVVKLATFHNEPRVQERQQMKDQQSCIFIFVAYPTIPSRPRSTSPDMATIFHAWPYGKFIEIHPGKRMCL